MVLPSTSLFSAFLAASLILAITLGPGVTFIVARSLADGRRGGMATVLGIALGNFINAVAAAIGLGALLAILPVAWQILRYAGAAYLAWLGVRALLRMRAGPRADDRPPAALSQLFYDGLIVALTNPKTLLFYAAFIPTFVNPAGSVAAQSLLLGGLFVAIALITDSTYALSASLLAPAISQTPRTARLAAILNATVFLSLAAVAAFTPISPP